MNLIARRDLSGRKLTNRMFVLQRGYDLLAEAINNVYQT
jgi:hypothetical protein